jgi:hypothetical protein
MKFCTFDETGKILSIGTARDDDPPVAFAHLGSRVVKWVSDAVTPSTHYVDVGVSHTDVCQIPTRPSPYHDFDYATHTWLERLGDAIAARKVEVNAERDRRNYLPITVNGVTLDADLVAQRNLSDKKAEADERIRLGIPMPTDLLIWKDCNNDLHTFDTLQDYADFISGFVVAMAERGTRLYVTSWAHKDKLDALTSVEAALAYDIGSGWPEL